MATCKYVRYCTPKASDNFQQHSLIHMLPFLFLSAELLLMMSSSDCNREGTLITASCAWVVMSLFNDVVSCLCDAETRISSSTPSTPAESPSAAIYLHCALASTDSLWNLHNHTTCDKAGLNIASSSPALVTYRIAWNYRGRNSWHFVCEFCSFVANHKSFLHKIWGCKSEQSMKVFSTKIVFLWKFSPLKVSHYTVVYVTKLVT